MSLVPKPFRSRFWPALLIISIVLLLIFLRGLWFGNVVFSNDSPLGAQVAASRRLPDVFSGGWQDLNSVGFREGGGVADFTFGLLYLVGPVGFAKLFAPFALFILGVGAWTFFRQSGLSPVACILGALGAVLNSTFFSVACWGVAGQTITVGMIFLALAALIGPSSKWQWLKVAAAGAAVGMAVTEGADVGAIFSLYIAAFVLYQSLAPGNSPVRSIANGTGKILLVATVAGLVAAQTIDVLVATQIKGVAGTKQDEKTKQERWDWATQWSLPKREALGFVVPGLFGYRMDTPNGMPAALQKAYSGGAYWGAVGRDPAWYHYWDAGSQGPQPQGGKRFSGGGIYAGVLVVLVAVWAALQSLRKKDSVFSLTERRFLWFWIAVILISLPLAFGRFAPFYRLLYALPYSSTIRNPGKFLYPVTLALVILFGYGIDGFWRRYMAGPAAAYSGWLETVKGWWQKVRGFDRRWTFWSLAGLGACVLGWLIYASSRQGLEAYLQQVDFDQPMASAIASFSYGQVGWFILTLTIAIGLITLVLSGVFRGERAKWGGILMGILLCLDLGRANQPWIVVWDYEHKYATNPIIDTMRQKACEQRVAILPRWLPSVFDPKLEPREQIINYLYGIEWSQHLFLYYNIQSLDVIQMPRMPEDLLAYDMAFLPRSAEQLARVGRKWQLTNTRYLLGSADFLPYLNQAIDPAQHSFRYKERFAIAPKPGYANSNNAADWTAVPDTNGPFALFEFTGALPRARLYPEWQLEPPEAVAAVEIQTNTFMPGDLELLKHAGTNGFLTLKRLSSPGFDPARTVIVSPSALKLPAGTNSPNAAGKVEFANYAPKDLLLKTEASTPTVLLLNDRYDPNWKVLVDGKPDTVLKCNYLMRGVFLQPGRHTVEFLFQPPMGSLYVSLAGVVLGILLCGLLLVVRNHSAPEPGAVEPGNTRPSEPKLQNNRSNRKGQKPAGASK